jgi:hypothetical protein
VLVASVACSSHPLQVNLSLLEDGIVSLGVRLAISMPDSGSAAGIQQRLRARFEWMVSASSSASLRLVGCPHPLSTPPPPSWRVFPQGGPEPVGHFLLDIGLRPRFCGLRLFENRLRAGGYEILLSSFRAPARACLSQPPAADSRKPPDTAESRLRSAIIPCCSIPSSHSMSPATDSSAFSGSGATSPGSCSGESISPTAAAAKITPAVPGASASGPISGWVSHSGAVSLRSSGLVRSWSGSTPCLACDSARQKRVFARCATASGVNSGARVLLRPLVVQGSLSWGHVEGPLRSGSSPARPPAGSGGSAMDLSPAWSATSTWASSA